jgi:hypothetical protein
MSDDSQNKASDESTLINYISDLNDEVLGLIVFELQNNFF